MPERPDRGLLPDLIPGVFDPTVPDDIPLELGLLADGDDITATADDGLDAVDSGAGAE